MQPKPKNSSRIVAVVLLVALSLSIAPSSANARPFSVSCGSSNGTVRSVSISSQVTGDRVRVCADWIKTSIGKGAAATKPTAKPTTASTSSSASGHIAYTPLNRSVVATANRPNIISVPNAQVSPKTSVLVFSDATRHTKVRQLLGYNTLIRFTPTAYRWTLGDSTTSTRSRVRHRFTATGLYFVRLSVTYAIELKVLPAGKWISTPLSIKKVADPLQLRVGQNQSIQGIPVFVIRDCRQMPGAIGC